MQKTRGVLTAFALLGVGISCASDQLRVVATQPLGKVEAAAVYLVAARQKPRIEASLRDAGIDLAEDLTEAGYLLRVTIGNQKGWRECGTLNNVKYALRREGHDVLVIVGSGWTGECNPGIFDRLSEQMRAAFRDSSADLSRDEEGD